MTQAPGRSVGRIVLSCLLWLLAAFLLFIGVVAIAIDVAGDKARELSPGATAFFWAAALLTGACGVAVWRGSLRVHSSRSGVAHLESPAGLEATGVVRQSAQHPDRPPGHADSPPAGAGRRAARAGHPLVRMVTVRLLWSATVLLLILGIASLVNAGSGTRSVSLRQSAVFFLITAAAAVGGWLVARGGRAAAAPTAVPSYRSGLASTWGLPAWADDDAPSARLPAVNAHLRYRERCSQFPVLGALIAGCLLAGGLTAMVLVSPATAGAAGAAGARVGILDAAAVISLPYFVLVLIDLPNGIDIADGRFTVGARGVRPAGRMWRRVSGPLAAVRSWDVLSKKQLAEFSRQRRAERGARLPSMGDLRMLGRRGCLRLLVDRNVIDAQFPSHVLLGFTYLPGSVLGGWDGTVLICTRRPAALTAALEEAMPGRRQQDRG